MIIRLLIASAIIAVIADHFGFLPTEFSNLFKVIGVELETYFHKGLKLIEDYAIHLALTFIGLCLITLMEII